ncbi:hypothetical protein LZZ85_21985 [Terrimonas sp. NA20]|uniref:GNAT family N-acetyltransferase n=1 Tax=Terrimonas ginsenosidimutans TaxID=2908004 RepID=A0ABS9KXE4_9BACT|nr:hypothetical protein [Terrimonas ginsenosidimutans]MCG2616983.1 hypothetical protein [Terrimonas ginsenosidimutans]
MLQNSFIIDKLTNSIEEVKSGENFDTEVLSITKEDLKILLKKNGWRFNWKNEFRQADHKLFKLAIKNNDVIQGMISIQCLKDFIEMHLIEVARHNFGKSKKFAGVAGNLVAFACRSSFDLGFDGVVAFTAKRQLIQHYQQQLGAELIFRNRMSISGKSAKKLVNSYYKNYLDGK